MTRLIIDGPIRELQSQFCIEEIEFLWKISCGLHPSARQHRDFGRLGDREKPGAERIAILGLGPGDYRGASLLRQVETMF